MSAEGSKEHVGDPLTRSPVPQRWPLGRHGPTVHRVLDCFSVVLFEEWWHHRYAARDLAILEAHSLD
jgi:hypothetical protein